MIYEIDLNGLAEGIKTTSTEGAPEISDVGIAIDFIYKKSQELVPVETGALRDSAYTQVIETQTGEQGLVKYERPYAMYVHEMPYIHEVGQAKYLEDAVMQYIKETKSKLSFKLYMDGSEVYVIVGSYATNSDTVGFELNFSGLAKVGAYRSMVSGLKLLGGEWYA